MTPSRTVLVTPENWFDVLRLSTTVAPAVRVRFMVAHSDGNTPLLGVALQELLAVHRTLGTWWSRLAAEAPPERVEPNPIDDCLAGTRRLVRLRAERALNAETVDSTQPSLLSFPNLEHELLATSQDALPFLANFLALRHPCSLISWARSLAMRDDSSTVCRDHAWLRLLLQKVTVEDDLMEARVALRAVYAGSEADRFALLADEARALEYGGLIGLTTWSRSLGLDRPERTESAMPTSTRRRPDSGRRPDITVLVPSYRHADYIETTIESVLGQTYTDFKLHVVDDCSPDETVSRARGFDDPRLLVTVNEMNLGLGDSTLRALQQIDTPYVALLNSDDLFHPERLERCRTTLEQQPTAQVVATGVVPIDAHGHRLRNENVSSLFDGRDIADWIQWHADTGRVAPDADLVAELLERNFLLTSSNIFCRTSFLRARSHVIRGLEYCLDWQIFLDAAIAGGLAYERAELLGYRLHPSNTVWFDDTRAVGYRLEANRVLATVMQALAPSSLADDTVATAFLETLIHAAKHSEARPLVMLAINLANSEHLEQGRTRSAAVNGQFRSITLPDDDLALQTARSEVLRLEARDGATRAIAEVDREDADAALASEVARYAEELIQVTGHLQGEVASKTAEVERLREHLEAAAASSAAQLEQMRGRLDIATASLEQTRSRLEAEMASKAAALVELRSAPEWLVGDRLWNRAGLSRIGRPAVRTLHSLRDRRNRWGLALAALVRRSGMTKPTAIVAACWSFPIHSQTFVYQEMKALEWIGLDYRIFCCDTNPKSELPGAFSDLWTKRLVMQSDYRVGQRDLDHFRRTRPARVDALIARLSEATGRSGDALIGESIVLTGFTFARHVEIARASYLHTYFFYDQSFLALMAAYLLQIPRGITAYADHMLGDYPFKLVPLHLELADIVVATSDRIRGELAAIGGGRFDDKILIKPNGIDVTRFPFVDAATRLALSGDAELVAVNRIEPKKGLVHLIEAVSLLQARGVSVRLNVVGGVDPNTPTSADCHRELLVRIDALRLGDRVVLHGVKQQHEFAPIVARSRVFVAPYVEVGSGDKDGIPTALLEAMSTGLPVVATDAGSIGEAVRNGVEALIVAQRDPVGLADAIERLLTEQDTYERMSFAARQRAAGEFDIHVTERRLHDRIRARLTRA